jgi:outer membrane protein TolC
MGLLALALWAPSLRAQPELPQLPPAEQAPSPRVAPPTAEDEGTGRTTRAPAEPVAPPSILQDDCSPISLSDAFYLGDVQNPELTLARQRITEAMARRMQAAAMLLPNVNTGGSYDDHTGPLQQSNGHILKVNRDSLYLGLGAYAIAAGTVNIPGITYSLNPVLSIYGFRGVRALVRQRQFESAAVRNQVLLRIALAYTDLLRAEGRRAVALQIREDVREVARITREQGQRTFARVSDADRAASELSLRNSLVVEAENEMLQASAHLAQELNIDPSVRLHVTDGWAVPVSIVPEPVPLNELVYIALRQRPELAAYQQIIQQAFLELQAARALPFSPNVIIGYSTGTFGGGGSFHDPGYFQPAGFVQPQARFGTFGPRQDIDVVAFWAAQNMGLGNWALMRQARSRLQQSKCRQMIVLDQVRDEVAEAYARVHARYAQIATSEYAVRVGLRAFEMDRERTRQGPREGLPIEVLDSLRLLAAARYYYLDNITAYNAAHFALYVALGTPPADVLARAIPARLVPPPPDARMEPAAQQPR